MRTQHIARVLLPSIIVFFLTGCQVFSPVGDFIGQRYTNTASYFNTFYNAQKSFTEAETEVLAGQQSAREKSAKGQTVAFVLSSTARQKFTNSIEKNSKLLSYYPTSKFVDDALLMIGKSYFYLEEDVKAERKFLELIAQYPEGALIPETKLWYGKSLLRQKRNTEGLQMLGTLYTEAMANGEEDIAGRAAVTVGEYYFAQDDFLNALKYYTESVEALSDGEENARTQFQIGICYSRLQRPGEAERAFRAVAGFSPDYNTAFQAAVYESRMLTQQKKFQPALELLFAKLDDSKYSEYFATAHREVGNTYAAEGDIGEAVAQYRYVDTAFARTDDAARSMFALASLYENRLFLFDSARTYYDKAKFEYSASEITPEATMKSETFGKYFALKRDLANYDTLIMETIHPRPKKPDSLAAAKSDSVHRSDSLALVQKTQTRIEHAVAAKGDTSAVPADTSAARGASGMIARNAPADTSATITPKAVLTPAMRDSLARVDSMAIASAAAAKLQLLDSLRHQVARTKFELAGLLYLEMNRSDSALVYYGDVVTLTNDSTLAARSYFTMAEIYASSDSASRNRTDSIYRKIIAIAPRSSYAQEARKNLGLPLLKEERDSAEVQYWAAERLLDTGNPAQAIQPLRALASSFPKSAYSPKALYTVGWIFENSLSANDSAESAYKELAERYPASTYTVTAQPKLSEIATVRREAEQKIKAEKDALVKAEAEKQKAKAEKEAKAKADAEKLKSPQRLQPAAPAAADSAGARTAPDSAAVRMPRDTTRMKPAVDSTSRLE